MIPGSANPLLLRTAAAGGYSISRSIRLNAPDSAYLSRTPASAGNRKTWTWAGWVKRSKLGSYGTLFECSNNSAYYNVIRFQNTDTLVFYDNTQGYVESSAVYRDCASWYHVVLAVDTTQSTASNRIKIYVNGAQVTQLAQSNYPVQNQDTAVNTTTLHSIGARYDSGGYSLGFDGYLADIHFIDGQALTPSSFGETDATTGVWVPKAYSGTYSGNSFWLPFSDNSAATATTLGKDGFGLGNNWTPNNLSVTAGAGNDSLVDVPTNGSQTDTGVGGEVRGNYCTMNPLDAASGAALSLTNGNLEHTNPSTAWKWRRGTFAMTTGKWYWEQTVSLGATASEGYLAGVATAAFDFNIGTGGLYARQSGTKYENGTTTSSVFSSTTAGDILGFAFDADSGKLWVSQNGTFVGSPTAGTGNSWASVPVGVFPLFAAYNVSGNIMNFGQRAFAYTAPSGFKALCTANLPAPVVTKPSTVMDVVLYTGNGSTQTISGLGLSPDLVWIKCRSTTYQHALFDSVRGVTKHLTSNNTDAEYTESAGNGLTAFNSDGFSLSGELAVGTGNINTSSQTYAAWAWDGGSSTVTNTQGSITSQVRANASAGFSVVTYTGTGVNGTVGHGLNVAPRMIISKSRNNANGDAGFWDVYHIGLTSALYFLKLNTTDAQTAASTVWNSTAPTSSVYSVGIASGTNAGSTATYVAYCFAPVVGYSSFGSYTGNGSTDGPFVYTGFRPRWILLKDSTNAGSWELIDTARIGYNGANYRLFPNLSDAEFADNRVDILSNGFKLRVGAGSAVNSSSAVIVYAAFAESPFNYARAR
jgi:hypothetical protein